MFHPALRASVCAALALASSLPALAAVPDVVRDAVATGDCSTVIARTEGLTDPGARLVRGRCQVILGEPAAAADTLAQVTEGVYGDVAARVRAQALLDLGRPEEALAATEGHTLPGAEGLRLRLIRGQALIALGRSLDARPDLRALLSTDVGDEARYWLAIGGRDRGDTAAAVGTFRAVWFMSVRGPWSDKAAAELDELGHPVPRFDTEEDRVLVRRRLDALMGAHRYDEALVLLRKLHEVDPAGPLQMAWACFRGRDYPASVAWYRKALGAPAEASGSPSQLFHYALATSRTGDYDTAAVIYKRLMATHPGDDKADTASYKLGYLHADKGEWAEATAEFERHLKAYPRSSHTDEALWWMGWGAFTEGRDEDARAAWARLRAARPSSSLVPGTLYWTARSEGRKGNADAERDGLTQVLSRYPTSGYAWFAAERLDAVHPARPVAERPAWPAALASRPEVARSDALLAIGLQDLAREELRPLASRATDRQSKLALAWALIETGAYQDGQRIARPYCVAPWKGGDPVAQQACYPRPAASVVHRTAERFGVPDLVPYGIMTTESALDPSVVSIAGARGLMQLMPVEAEGLHRTLYGERPYHPDMLFSAPYNASLGVAELGTKQQALGDVLDGPDIVAAIAAYNGGETAVARWVEGLGGKPEFDHFAEQIGYTETRRYVRKVLGVVMAYRHVYGDAPEG